MIDIQIDGNVESIIKSLKHIKRAIPRATRRAIRRTMPVLEKSAVIETMKVYRFNSQKVVRKRWLEKSINTIGRDASKHHGMLGIRDQTAPLIFFIRGNKKPRKQKGIPVKRRRPITVEVRRGKRIKAKRDFIIRGTNQLFRHVKGSDISQRQVVPGIHHLFERSKQRRERTIKPARKRFIKEFMGTMEFVLETEAKKIAGKAG